MDDIEIINNQTNAVVNRNNINPKNRLFDEENLAKIKSYINDHNVRNLIHNKIWYYYANKLRNNGRKMDMIEVVDYILNNL